MATHKVPERRGKAGQEPPRGPLLSGQESLSRYTPIGQELGIFILIGQSPHVVPFSVGKRVSLLEKHF